MKKTVREYLSEVTDYIERIRSAVANSSEQELWRNQDLQDMLLRRIEILGEIVKRFPDDFKSKYNHVPWKQIAGARDKVAHDYDGIDMSEVWQIAKVDVENFAKEVEKMLEDIDRQISS